MLGCDKRSRITPGFRAQLYICEKTVINHYLAFKLMFTFLGKESLKNFPDLPGSHYALLRCLSYTFLQGEEYRRLLRLLSPASYPKAFPLRLSRRKSSSSENVSRTCSRSCSKGCRNTQRYARNSGDVLRRSSPFGSYRAPHLLEAKKRLLRPQSIVPVTVCCKARLLLKDPYNRSLRSRRAVYLRRLRLLSPSS
ncbi:unnamed protein product [Coccothraustes coccothraustes]